MQEGKGTAWSGGLDREAEKMRKNTKAGINRMGKKLPALLLAMLCAFPETAFGAGWERQPDGGWRYQKEDGSYLYDGFSADGYYVDTSGIWWEHQEILGGRVASRNTFLTPDQAGSLESFADDLRPMLETIGRDCGNVRSMALEEKRITCFALKDQTEQELFSFYKDEEGTGYVLRIKCRLSNTKGLKARSSWYDYQLITAILARVSPAGRKVAEAVYSSWKEDNQYGIKSKEWVLAGDTWIRYEAVQGAGLYYIAGRQEDMQGSR